MSEGVSENVVCVCVCLSVCMCVSGGCVIVVSTQFIFSIFGGFWSLYLGSTVAKKQPRPTEALHCVAVMKGRVLLVCLGDLYFFFFFLFYPLGQMMRT